MYSVFSPYAATNLVDGKFLDIMVNRDIPKYADDTLYTITPTYTMRPDNLAYDLYGNASLWWVFSARNKNTLIDPIWDFVTGTTIYLPKKATLMLALGL